jgi:hypothetical protein
MVYAALDEVKVDNMIEPDKPLSHITAMLSIFASLDGGKMPAKASFISAGTLVKIMSELYKK